jgi:CDP-paratose 2-epimerase
MGERGLLQLCAAVGFHGFPGTWDSEEAGWHGWDMHLGEMRAVIDRWNPEAEVWITETGYSTWRNDEMEQARRFARAMEAGADRLYWYGWRDLPPDVPVQEGLWFDPRHYHLGAVTAGNQPKLLARLLTAGGVARVREVTRLAAPRLAPSVRPAVVTGGAGFIGANLADALLTGGEEVLVLDNLSRAGVEDNLSWLVERHGARVHFVPADLRQESGLAEVVADASSVFHLAAQTAVTTSLAPGRRFRGERAGHAQPARSRPRDGAAVPVVFAGHEQGLRRARRRGAWRTASGICPRTPRCAGMALARTARSTSARPTAARRAWPTSTCSTTRPPTGCRRRCCG